MHRAERRLAAAALCTVLLALAGCTQAASSHGPPERAGPSPKPGLWRGTDYVALGDSYTAAPYVPVTDLAAGCLRSTGNYPHLVAERLGAHLHDVSCGGADTDDITGSQDAPNGTRHPPQIRAVTHDARVVTVGIGGNDRHLFGTLLDVCLREPSSGSSPSAEPCAGRVSRAIGGPASVVESIRDRVTAVLRAVKQRAPRAVVVLVGYPRLVSADRSCAAVPLPTGDRVFLAGVENRLNGALAAAARAAGARFVDMHRLSVGHEICSAQPWVNGPATDRRRALAFHPFAVEQRAVADAVVKAVDRP